LITTTGNATKCYADPDTISATGGATYLWTPAAGLACSTCATTLATPAVSTTYKVYVTTIYGCTDSSTVTVGVRPLPVLTATSGKVCFGKDTTLSVSGAVSYVWTPATGLSATTGSTVIASPFATTYYTIRGTDGYNCSNTVRDSLVIMPLSAPPTVVSPVNYCIAAPTIPLTATGTNLLWYLSTGGSGSSTAPTPSTEVPGSTWYYVSQNTNGCESPLDSIDVVVYPKPKADFDWKLTVGCKFDSVGFANLSSGATKYLWTFADGRTDSEAIPSHQFHIVLDTTHNWVKLVASNPGCPADSTSKDVLLYPIPPHHFLYDVTLDQTINWGESAQLDVKGGYIYWWRPDNGTLDNPNINNPVAKPTEKTTYIVYSYDKLGCLDSAQTTVDVIYTQEWIPSAFTPNGDGINDIFHVVNLRGGKLIDMFIYDRWGELVCHTRDNEKGWDGKYRGTRQDLNVFNYYIVVERESHEVVYYKGDVTLIR
jgi:gliding motility-associated-like protein